MKKLFMFFVILLTGCVMTDSLLETPTNNEDCINVRRFKVLQATYHNTGLAFECFTPNCDDYYRNNLDFIIGYKFDEDLYDGMIYEVPYDKCAVRQGVYKYETKDGSFKTVSQIRFDYKEYPRTEEERQNRVNEAKENMYNMCLWMFKERNIKKDEKYCACYGNSFINNKGDASAIRKECGKLPKFLPGDVE